MSPLVPEQMRRSGYVKGLSLYIQSDSYSLLLSFWKDNHCWLMDKRQHGQVVNILPKVCSTIRQTKCTCHPACPDLTALPGPTAGSVGGVAEMHQRDHVVQLEGSTAITDTMIMCLKGMSHYPACIFLPSPPPHSSGVLWLALLWF